MCCPGTSSLPLAFLNSSLTHRYYKIEKNHARTKLFGGYVQGGSGNISTELPGWKGLGNLGTNMYVHFLSVCCHRLLFESSTRIKKEKPPGGCMEPKKSFASSMIYVNRTRCAVGQKKLTCRMGAGANDRLSIRFGCKGNRPKGEPENPPTAGSPAWLKAKNHWQQ
jgi:hypothetical protein